MERTFERLVAGEEAPSGGSAPISGTASARPVSSGPRRRSGASGPRRILIVEDNPVDAKIVEERLLEREPTYDVAVAARLADATALLEAEGFDVVLLDLHLPDGEELVAVEAIRAASARTPIVVLTGTEDHELARRCIELGADDYLDKATMTAHQLGRAVGYALARARARDLSERLEHSDRLAAIGRLAVSVAHEINNPITFITMNQELLLRRLESLRASTEGGANPEAALLTVRSLAAEMHEMLIENARGVERIAAIVRDLRTLSRQDHADPKPVDPIAVCKAACAVVENHVRYRARMEARYESVSKVLVDARKLEQVVINLVANAAQAIVRGAASENHVRVSTYEEGGSVVIAVEDTGAGMSSRVRARVFEPFFSTKAAGEGTGLGLSVSADIVESFGGTITVESELGRGSRFEVRLPRVAEEWNRPAPAATTTKPPAQRPRRRVLLVDDDPQVLVALQRSIALTHDVIIAKGGREALETLAAGGTFDVIVCDLTMPDVDGTAVFAALRADFPALASRLIVLTGGALTDHTAEFVESSGVLVLAKPVVPETLLRTIDQVTRPAQ